MEDGADLQTPGSGPYRSRVRLHVGTQGSRLGACGLERFPEDAPRRRSLPPGQVPSYSFGLTASRLFCMAMHEGDQSLIA